MKKPVEDAERRRRGDSILASRIILESSIYTHTTHHERVDTLTKLTLPQISVLFQSRSSSQY